MKIIIKAKAPIIDIEESDFLDIKNLFERLMKKYGIDAEIKNFRVVGNKNRTINN